MFLIPSLERALRMEKPFTLIDYGVKYPDGRINWTPDLDIFLELSRQRFIERYQRNLRDLGIPEPWVLPEFVQREFQITFPEGVVPSPALTPDEIDKILSFDD